MIREVRDALVKEINDCDPPWSVYGHKPDNVNDVPCVVVDRPSVTVNVQHTTCSTPVVVIGRRDGSEDAQRELDDVTSTVARYIAGPEFAVVRIEPATATIADLTFPAYEITVSCGVTTC
jgi:hypothetical protein